MYLKDAIEQRIESLCKERNITVNKLCMISGVTQSTLANLRQRPTTNVSTLAILRLCRGLDITMDEFFNDEIFRTNDFDDD